MPGFEVIGEEEKKAVLEIFEKSNGVLFAHGFDNLRKSIYRVREFEKAFATKMKVSYAQAVSSATAGLFCAIKAMGIGSGDEVITQSFTFVATVEAILAAGARPVIVNINKTLNMDPLELSEKITDHTKLVIPVHMAGVSAQMDEIIYVAKNKKIRVLEDAAQAIGGRYKGYDLGTIADAGVISLDFGKTITCGEGGMVLTNNAEIYREIRCYHDHGHEYNLSLPRGRDSRHAPGFNFRMTELQAAVGLAQLNKLDYIISKQRKNKLKLKAGLKNLALNFRQLPDPEGDAADTCFIMVDSKERADIIVKALVKNGLVTKNVPDAFNWHFAGTWDHMIGHLYKRPLLEEFRKSLEILERTVALPIWVQTKEPWIEKYIDTIRSCF